MPSPACSLSANRRARGEWSAWRASSGSTRISTQLAALLERHASSTLLTTNPVRGETWTYLRRRAGHGSAVGFLDAIDTSPRIVVEHVDAAAEATAAKWLRSRGEREYSFVDATSCAVMKARRLDSALAFDGDFAAPVADRPC